MIINSRKSTILILAYVSLGLPSIALSADVNQSLMLANPCISCHGPDNKSAGSIPPLVGLKQDYIIAAMKAFKSDERQGTVMNRIAKGYSDEEIAVLAGYFQK